MWDGSVCTERVKLKVSRKSVSIQKFSKNVRIHFAVGNCKGNYFNKEIWVLLNFFGKEKVRSFNST